jgi:hypothetical protein
MTSHLVRVLRALKLKRLREMAAGYRVAGLKALRPTSAFGVLLYTNPLYQGVKVELIRRGMERRRAERTAVRLALPVLLGLGLLAGGLVVVQGRRSRVSAQAAANKVLQQSVKTYQTASPGQLVKMEESLSRSEVQEASQAVMEYTGQAGSTKSLSLTEFIGAYQKAAIYMAAKKLDPLLDGYLETDDPSKALVVAFTKKMEDFDSDNAIIKIIETEQKENPGLVVNTTGKARNEIPADDSDENVATITLHEEDLPMDPDEAQVDIVRMPYPRPDPASRGTAMYNIVLWVKKVTWNDIVKMDPVYVDTVGGEVEPNPKEYDHGGELLTVRVSDYMDEDELEESPVYVSGWSCQLISRTSGRIYHDDTRFPNGVMKALEEHMREVAGIRSTGFDSDGSALPDDYSEDMWPGASDSYIRTFFSKEDAYWDAFISLRETARSADQDLLILQAPTLYDYGWLVDKLNIAMDDLDTRQQFKAWGNDPKILEPYKDAYAPSPNIVWDKELADMSATLRTLVTQITEKTLGAMMAHEVVGSEMTVYRERIYGTPDERDYDLFLKGFPAREYLGEGRYPHVEWQDRPAPRKKASGKGKRKK